MPLLPRALSLVAVCALAARGQAEDRALASKLRDFDRYAARGVVDWNVPGLAVAIVKDGGVVFAKGYGVRQLGHGESVTTRTLFAVGSTTKAMTAAALGLLVDEGKLRFDDPVTRHLPGFAVKDAFVTREATVRDLLTHRAGMPGTDFLWYRTSLAPDEVLKRMALVEPETSMRSHFQYQNVMYHAAGGVLRAVSGMPWADFLEQRLFAPLGTTSSSRPRPWWARTASTRPPGSPSPTGRPTAWAGSSRTTRDGRWTSTPGASTAWWRSAASCATRSSG
jgi:CubicO group peptidase (beta-lactamase class C family)